MKIVKPWGYEELLVNNGVYVVKKLFVRKNERLSLQLHKSKKETWLVWKGKGEIVLGTETIEFEIKELPKIIDIPAGTIHRVCADTDTYIYEVSTPELEDVVRLQNDYGRVDRKTGRD